MAPLFLLISVLATVGGHPSRLPIGSSSSPTEILTVQEASIAGQRLWHGRRGKPTYTNRCIPIENPHRPTKIHLEWQNRRVHGSFRLLGFSGSCHSLTTSINMDLPLIVNNRKPICSFKVVWDEEDLEDEGITIVFKEHPSEKVAPHEFEVTRATGCVSACSSDESSSNPTWTWKEYPETFEMLREADGERANLLNIFSKTGCSDGWIGSVPHGASLVDITLENKEEGLLRSFIVVNDDYVIGRK